MLQILGDLCIGVLIAIVGCIGIVIVAAVIIGCIKAVKKEIKR